MTTSATARITATQAKVLRTLVALGGEANWYRSERGLDSRCQRSLLASGLVDFTGTCACFYGEPCDRGHADLPGRASGTTCYQRTRINDAGRAALAAYDLRSVR